MMNNRLTGLLVVTLLTAAFSTNAEDWSQLVLKAMPSVVSLRPYNGNGQQLGISSGFAYGEDLIITCWHCVPKDATRMIASTKDGESYEITHVAAAYPEGDLAILRYKGGGIPPLELAIDESLEGSPAIVIGSPLGLDFSVSAGIVSSWRTNEDDDSRREVQFTSPISPGNSGGPIFDKNGRVLGVVSYRILDDGVAEQALNFGISFSEIKKLLVNQEDTDVVDFNSRYDKYKKIIGERDLLQDAFYDHLVRDWIYNREYYRRVAIHTLDSAIRKPKGLSRDEQRAVKKKRSDMARRDTNYDPWLFIETDQRGRVGRIATGERTILEHLGVSSPYFSNGGRTMYGSASIEVTTIISDNEAIVRVKRWSQGRTVDSEPIIVSGVSFSKLIEGDRISLDGLYYSHGVQMAKDDRGRRFRYRSIAAIDWEQMKEAFERLPVSAVEEIEEKAKEDHRRNKSNHWNQVLGL